MLVVHGMSCSCIWSSSLEEISYMVKSFEFLKRSVKDQLRAHACHCWGPPPAPSLLAVQLPWPAQLADQSAPPARPAAWPAWTELQAAWQPVTMKMDETCWIMLDPLGNHKSWHVKNSHPILWRLHGRRRAGALCRTIRRCCTLRWSVAGCSGRRAVGRRSMRSSRACRGICRYGRGRGWRLAWHQRYGQGCSWHGTNHGGIASHGSTSHWCIDQGRTLIHGWLHGSHRDTHRWHRSNHAGLAHWTTSHGLIHRLTHGVTHWLTHGLSHGLTHLHPTHGCRAHGCRTHGCCAHRCCAHGRHAGWHWGWVPASLPSCTVGIVDLHRGMWQDSWYLGKMGIQPALMACRYVISYIYIYTYTVWLYICLFVL